MARTVLDKELEALNQQIIQLGSLVDDALARSLDALEKGDLATAGLLIENDSQIDSLRVTIEEHTLRLLTLQQPLGGRDLRYLTSSLSIAGDLERTGDGTAGIAQIILRMAPLRGEQLPSLHVDGDSARGAGNEQITEASLMRGLLDLGKEARKVLQETMKAFANRDAAAAYAIRKEDDVVDVRYHLVRHDLMAMMTGARAIPALQNDALILQRVTYLLWIAHKLERVSDHCTNICERIVFTEEGENIIHTPEPA